MSGVDSLRETPDKQQQLREATKVMSKQQGTARIVGATWIPSIHR